MRWKDSNAPGGYWVDTVTVSPDFRSYEGTNNVNDRISGAKE